MKSLGRSFGVFSFRAMLIVGGVLAHYQEAKARFFILSDFDNTTVETRRTSGRGRRYNGSFETPFIWSRMTMRPNGFLMAPEGPLTVEVSPAERHRLMAQLGHGEGRPGQLGQKAKLSSGVEIQPGLYMEINPLAFQYFLASPPDRNYLQANLLRAFSREEKGEFTAGSWQGPFWPYVQQVLGSAETASQFGHLTSRGHDYREWREFYEELRTRKYIEFMPYIPLREGQRSLFRNLSRSEFDHLDMGGSISERKAKSVQEIALALRFAPVTDEDLRISLDGRSKERLHSIVCADDDQKTLERMIELVTDVVRRKLAPLKMVFFNAGTDQEVIESGRPRAFVITESGGFRAASVLELLGEPPHLTEGQRTFVEGCGSALAGE